jgi:hypothetical protein
MTTTEQSKENNKLRLYPVGETYYPSVTAILSYTLGLNDEMMNWVARNSALRALRENRAALKEGKKKTQKELVDLALTERHRLVGESQLKGTTVHGWVEDFYNGKMPTDIPKNYQGYWNSFLKFNDYFPLKPLIQEKIVHSDEYKYAGRVDFVGTMTQNGVEKTLLVDFKTSNFLKAEMGLQLTAYKHCLETMGYKIDETYILHLTSGGFYDFVKFDEPLENFLLVRKLFDWKVEKENPEFELAPQEKYVQ